MYECLCQATMLLRVNVYGEERVPLDRSSIPAWWNLGSLTVQVDWLSV